MRTSLLSALLLFHLVVRWAPSRGEMSARCQPSVASGAKEKSGLVFIIPKGTSFALLFGISPLRHFLGGFYGLPRLLPPSYPSLRFFSVYVASVALTFPDFWCADSPKKERKKTDTANEGWDEDRVPTCTSADSPVVPVRARTLLSPETCSRVLLDTHVCMPAIIPSLSAALVAALCLGLLLQWQSLARSVLNIPATSTSSQRASGELETCRSELSYVQRLLLGEKLARVEAPLSELARVEAPLSEEDALIMARLRREGASPGEPWRLLPPLDPPVPPAWEVADPEEVQRCGISLKVLGEGGAASADLCKLDRRLATSLAVSNVLIVTWAAGAAWQPFVFNWVQHLRRINVSNHLVGALDTALLAALLERRVPCFYVNLGATTTGTKVSRESSAFYTLGSHKLHLIAHLLELGVTPLVTDVDLVLLRDPTPYVLRYQRADLLVTSDILWSTVEDDGLEEPNAWRASPLAPYGINFPLRAPNIGAMALRPNNRTRELLERWQTDLQLCLKRKLAGERLHCWDQQFLAWILAQRGEGAYPGERPDGTLLPPMVESRIYMSPSNLTVGFLPVRKFCNGNTFASQRLHLRGVADERLPYAVHITHARVST